jgi:hypothetical protein
LRSLPFFFALEGESHEPNNKKRMMLASTNLALFSRDSVIDLFHILWKTSPTSVLTSLVFVDAV